MEENELNTERELLRQCRNIEILPLETEKARLFYANEAATRHLGKMELLCTKASRNQIELMELDKSGIAVAEYWTNLPPKEEFERKINEILIEARERLERRKSLPKGKAQKQLDYFYDSKDADIEDK